MSKYGGAKVVPYQIIKLKRVSPTKAILSKSIPDTAAQKGCLTSSPLLTRKLFDRNGRSEIISAASNSSRPKYVFCLLTIKDE